MLFTMYNYVILKNINGVKTVIRYYTTVVNLQLNRLWQVSHGYSWLWDFKFDDPGSLADAVVLETVVVWSE